MTEPCFLNMAYDQCHIGIGYGLQYLWTIPVFFGIVTAISTPIIWKIINRNEKPSNREVKHD